MDAKTVGKTIASLRKKHGLTQSALAEKLNVRSTPSTNGRVLIMAYKGSILHVLDTYIKFCKTNVL